MEDTRNNFGTVSKFAQARTLLVCIRKMPVPVSTWTPTNLTEFLHCFPQFFQVNLYNLSI